MTARPAAVAGGALACAAAANLLPGLTAWRDMRCTLLARLAGVGAAAHVALTFDDGPAATSTPAVLDSLDRLGWRATFFLLGSEVDRKPELAAEVAARGHEVALHGYHHANHLWHAPPWVAADVRRGYDRVSEAAGAAPRWFRPPYGALAASSIAAARRCGLKTVLWTTWGRDWRRDATGPTVAAEVEATFRPGATVLLHDSDVTSAPGSWRATLAALPLLSERWGAAGLAVGPLAEHGL